VVQHRAGQQPPGVPALEFGFELGPSRDEPLVWVMFKFCDVVELCFEALAELLPRALLPL
jgi:hypothetical protein